MSEGITSDQLETGVVSVFTHTETLNNAAIKALPTTPYQLLPAPGAGKAIIPVAWTFRVNTTAGEYTNVNNAAWQLFAAGAPGGFTMVAPMSLLGAAQVTARSICGSESFVGSGTFDGSVIQASTNIAENAAIVLSDAYNGTDYTGGSVANSASVAVLYAVIDV